MLNNEKLRIINANFPEIVERLITLYGSASFSEYLGSLLRGAKNGSMPHLTEEVTSALSTIKTDHDTAFPKHIEQLDASYPEKCAQNVQFKMINERFPRIGKQLGERWGHFTFPEYINELLTDARGGRQGFPSEILSALFALIRAHEQEFPELATKIKDVWTLQMKE